MAFTCNIEDFRDYKLTIPGCYKFTENPSENKTIAYRRLNTETPYMMGQLTLGIPLVKMKDLFIIFIEKKECIYGNKCFWALECLKVFTQIYINDDIQTNNIYLCIFYCLICYLAYQEKLAKGTMKSYFKAFFPIKFRTNLLKLFEDIPDVTYIEYINTLDKKYVIDGEVKDWANDPIMHDNIKEVFDAYNKLKMIDWVDMFEFDEYKPPNIVFELRSLDELYKLFNVSAIQQYSKIKELIKKLYEKLQCDFTWGIELETRILYYYKFIKDFIQDFSDIKIKTGKNKNKHPTFFITYFERQLEFQSEIFYIHKQHKPPYFDCGFSQKKCKKKECEKVGIYASNVDTFDKIFDTDDIDDIVAFYTTKNHELVCEEHRDPEHTIDLSELCASNINVLEFTLGVFNYCGNTQSNKKELEYFSFLYNFIANYLTWHYKNKKAYIGAPYSIQKSAFKKIKRSTKRSTKRSMNKKTKKLSKKSWSK